MNNVFLVGFRVFLSIFKHFKLFLNSQTDSLDSLMDHFDDKSSVPTGFDQQELASEKKPLLQR